MKGNISSLLIMSSAAMLNVTCGGNNTASNVDTPGTEKSGKDKALETAADLIQDKSPLKAFNVYLDGFHFYNGNINAQMEAHHYVQQLSDDLYQAIIFDGNGKDAKIMGVEYIVTEKLFQTLPAEEKMLWHSHHHEVKSGTLIAPGIPEKAEYQLMEKLVKTYGKTIHTWHTDQERNLPVGAPMIMMGFTKDGQLKPGLIEDRDKRFHISTAEKKESRKSIPNYVVDPLANAWEQGHIRQFVIGHKADSARHKH
ncbi:OBAP family protein [Sphingobacterium multivorum]|uniref:OBAP family protein n=1 Tax=Sphingobacterium multivorum TaxID=28454 RepID=UPI0030193528